MTRRFKYRLPLVSVLLVTTALGACGSSGGDDDGSPPNDGQTSAGADGGDTGGVATGGTDGDESGGTGTEGSVTGGAGGGEGGGTGTDGGSDTGGVLDPISGEGATSFGFVQIEQPSPGDDPLGEEAGSASAAFFRFGVELPVEQAAAQILPALDTCTVFGADEVIGNEGTGGDDTPDIDFDYLSADETITLTSPAGTWLTLPRTEQLGFVLYQNENALPLPVPAGLVLDIPGDEFPAFSSVAIPDVTPLTGLVPASDPAASVGADSLFRWDAGSADSSVYIDISLIASDPGGADPSVTSVNCLARDDGEFALPAATRAELGDDFSGLAVVSRIGVRAELRAGALLLVTSSSTAN